MMLSLSWVRCSTERKIQPPSRSFSDQVAAMETIQSWCCIKQSSLLGLKVNLKSYKIETSISCRSQETIVSVRFQLMEFHAQIISDPRLKQSVRLSDFVQEATRSSFPNRQAYNLHRAHRPGFDIEVNLTLEANSTRPVTRLQLALQFNLSHSTSQPPESQARGWIRMHYQGRPKEPVLVPLLDIRPSRQAFATFDSLTHNGFMLLHDSHLLTVSADRMDKLPIEASKGVHQTADINLLIARFKRWVRLTFCVP